MNSVLRCISPTELSLAQRAIREFPLPVLAGAGLMFQERPQNLTSPDRSGTADLSILSIGTASQIECHVLSCRHRARV
jgi:hypothetical protein